jgi:hypothetical protein
MTNRPILGQFVKFRKQSCQIPTYFSPYFQYSSPVKISLLLIRFSLSMIAMSLIYLALFAFFEFSTGHWKINELLVSKM